MVYTVSVFGIVVSKTPSRNMKLLLLFLPLSGNVINMKVFISYTVNTKWSLHIRTLWINDQLDMFVSLLGLNFRHPASRTKYRRTRAPDCCVQLLKRLAHNIRQTRVARCRASPNDTPGISVVLCAPCAFSCSRGVRGSRCCLFYSNQNCNHVWR